MIEKPIESGIYNISDDETISTVQIIETMSDVLQKKSRIWNIPQNLILLMAQFGTVLHLPFNKDRLQKLTENYQVDNQKIKNNLGVPVLPMSALEGLRKTLNALK
jgi:nucleoside-diphosphate-sugar epimerase